MTTIIGIVTDLFPVGKGVNVRIRHQDGESVLVIKDSGSLIAATNRGAAACDDEIEIGYKATPAWMNDIAGEILQARVIGYQVEELPYAA